MSSPFDALFSSFFFLVFFFFALGKALANIITQICWAPRVSFLSLDDDACVGVEKREREREGGNARDGTIHFSPTNIKSASRRDDDAVVFSVGLRRRPGGTRFCAVGRREAPRTKAAARRFGGNNNNNNNNTLAGWSVDQRRALPTRKEDTNDGVKIRRGDFAPVAAGGGVFLR